MSTYRDNPVQVLAGIPREVLENAEPAKPRRHSGEAISRLVDIAAIVGEFAEVWWAATVISFTVDENGTVFPDLRPATFRSDTPDVVTTEMDDGTIAVNYDKAHDRLRKKGWLRIDPILKELGVSEDGLLTRQQWESPLQHKAVCALLCNADVLARVLRLNDASFTTAHRERMPYEVPAQLESLRVGLNNLQANPPARGSVEVKANVQRWIDAMNGAEALLKAPAVTSDNTSEPAKSGKKGN